MLGPCQINPDRGAATELWLDVKVVAGWRLMPRSATTKAGGPGVPRVHAIPLP